MKKFIKYTFYFFLGLFLVFSLTPYFISINEKQFNSDVKPFANSFFIEHEGMKIHYRVWEPIGAIQHKAFFIHGFSGSTFCFRKNVDALVQQGTLVIALDLPGFGYSEKNKLNNYDENTNLEIISNLIRLHDKQHMSTSKWLIAGHSMGAGVAARFANAFPERIDHLVMIDGLAGMGPSSGTILLSYPPLARWAEVILEHKLSSFESFQGLLESAYSGKATNEDVNGYREPFLFAGSASAVFKVMNGGGELKKNYTGKTLIVWGVNDQWIPIENAYYYLQKNKSALFHPIPDAGHCCMETHGSEVNRALLYFMHLKE